MTLYELAHVIKERCGFLWDMVEWGNAELFACLHKTKLRDIPNILEKYSTHFVVRETSILDVKPLVKFFSEQPSDAYTFFKPHGFDEKSVKMVVKNKAFLTYVIVDENTIVGYFFLRSFVNGKCFRGRMVSETMQGKGLGKLMSIAMGEIAAHLELRMFCSISPENYASLHSAKSTNDIKIIKTLENGYYYIECTPKMNNAMHKVNNLNRVGGG